MIRNRQCSHGERRPSTYADPRLHADPHYVRKLIEARPRKFCPVRCNTSLERTVARVPNGCAANPQTTSRPPGYRPSPPRVLVVGGGMRACMRPAAKRQGQMYDPRGSEISAVRSAQPPGPARPWRPRRLVEPQLHKLNVPVVMGLRSASRRQSHGPDVVVVATGACGGTPG